MINLIKNELFKIFHKKFIYVMAILIIVLRIFVAVISNIDVSIDFSTMFFEPSVKALENADSSMSNEEKMYLVNDKNTYDTFKLIKDEGLKTNSWEAYTIVNGKINENIACMNENKYITKDEDAYNLCKEEYESNLKKVRDGDWEYFVNLDLDEAKAELASSGEENELLKNRIKGDEYRLEYKVPYDYSLKSSILYDYSFMAFDMDLINKDESKITKRSELIDKRNAEKNYKELVYKVENNILPEANGLNSSQESVLSNFTYTSFFLVILVVILGATIVADEFNKGTIKQLLLKPYTRAQILISKYISCLIVFFLFVIGSLLAYSIIDGIAYGFKDLFMPVVVYNFNSGSIMEMNTFVYALLSFICLLPHYLILFTVGFFISILLENGVVGIIVPLVLDTFADIISALIPKSLERFGAFLPSSCWELNQFLFGGLANNQYSNIWISIIVDIVVLGLLIWGSLWLFKKKDIKNQ